MAATLGMAAATRAAPLPPADAYALLAGQGARPRNSVPNASALVVGMYYAAAASPHTWSPLDSSELDTVHEGAFTQDRPCILANIIIIECMKAMAAPAPTLISHSLVDTNL